LAHAIGIAIVDKTAKYSLHVKKYPLVKAAKLVGREAFSSCLLR
jgi:hypothetical protein